MNDERPPDEPSGEGPGARRRRRFRRLLRRGRRSTAPQRFSTVLRNLADGPDERIAIRRFIEVFEDRAFGALMFIFAVPNLIPLPPGTSSIFGAPLIVIAFQLVLGRKMLWLPTFLSRQSVRAADLRRVLDHILPHLRRAERFLSPRFAFLFGIAGDRVIGAICLTMAVILFLPIPLVNMLPALSIACFSLALMERDGLLAMIGLVAAAASALVVVAISGALWVSVKAFFNAIMPRL